MEALRNMYADLRGIPYVEPVEGGMRLRGKYPDPEAGLWIGRVMVFLMCAIIIAVPPLYYGEPGQPPESPAEIAAAIIGGMPAALGALVELAREWEPGKPLPDLRGWTCGLSFAAVIFFSGSFAWMVWRELTDRPRLTVTVDENTVGIRRGFFGPLVEIPRQAVTAVHAARRKSGAYEVLIQHDGGLTPVAMMTGHERRALLLKAKLDALIGSARKEDHDA